MDAKITLSELQKAIRDMLYMSFPDMYWVVAEISEITENYAGHCFLELIEKNEDEKNVRARIRGIIWCKSYRFLKPFFEDATGERLRIGMKVLVKVKVEYNEIYGLSLIICDIDPAFTLGEMAMKRQLIIKRLEDEGIFNMNRETGLPFSLQRIAVISSATAAGYQDFMNHLTGNAGGYIFYTKLFESPMQGPETEQGIISALDRVAIHAEHFDAVVIIRGGGSQTDLSWFDNYSIAFHVTQFPLPVITGIGHDKDMSVTDMVACLALKTPTAVADFLVEHMDRIDNRLSETANRIADISRLNIEQNRSLLDSSSSKLVSLCGVMLSGSERFLLNAIHNIQTGSSNLVRISGMRLSAFEKTLEMAKPENVLRRGYSITYSNGKIIKGINDLACGDPISTRLSDGKICSLITSIENDEMNSKD